MTTPVFQFLVLTLLFSANAKLIDLRDKDHSPVWSFSFSLAACLFAALGIVAYFTS